MVETNIILQDNKPAVAEFSIIQSKIREVRGLKVILDFDLAEMYEVETRRLNEVVKRNIKRFPSDFMFQLTSQEFSNLISQIATSSWGGTRKLPYAFTEQGIAMLSGLLNSDIAINTNIVIMRAFVMLRQYALGYLEIKNELQAIYARLDKNDTKFDTIFQILDEFMEQKKELEQPRKPIGYKKYEN